VLEANDWTFSLIADDGHPDERPSTFAESDDGDGFDLEVSELEREMSGLRMAIEKGGDDDDDGIEHSEDGDDDELRVEQLDGLLLRMQAIKDMGADLPMSERKKFAAKAIRDIMKDL